MRLQKLFEPGQIGTLRLKNRIMMAPMGNRLCGVWGEVTDRLVEFYRRRAQGGCGLIVVEAAHAATALDPLKVQSRMLRVDDDSYCPGLFQITEAVHDAGAKVGIQLVAGFGANAIGAPWILGRQYIEDTSPVGPSDIAPAVIKKRPRALTIEEIEKIVELVGWAATRIKKAGFDTIEIHASGGMLLQQFLSPYFNKRVDRYGGDLDGRMRFLLEIVESVRSRVGPEYPLTARLTIDELMDGGIVLAEGQEMARRLEQVGINGLHVSQGSAFGPKATIGTMYYDEGYIAPLADATKKMVKIPVIASGRFADPLLAERVLKEGKTDFIALGRPLIADPDWPKKAAEGRIREIRKCLACNECWERMLRYSRVIRCAVNPVAGRECDYDIIKPAERTRKVVVIGAGPAGMEAARVAAIRGHSVRLYDKNDEIGGQLRFAKVPPHKEVLGSIPDFYEAAFRRLRNLKIELGKEVTNDHDIEEADVVIVATGGEPIVPDIPGVKRKNVFTAFDILTDGVEIGEQVVVAGGGLIGCETANYLAQQNKKVAIVEMLDEVAGELDRVTRPALLNELAQAGVKILTGTTITAITDKGVTVSDRQGHKTTLPANAVVLALGLKPESLLERVLAGRVPELHVIGDAKEPRRILDAIAEGFVVGYHI